MLPSQSRLSLYLLITARSSETLDLSLRGSESMSATSLRAEGQPNNLYRYICIYIGGRYDRVLTGISSPVSDQIQTYLFKFEALRTTTAT